MGYRIQVSEIHGEFEEEMKQRVDSLDDAVRLFREEVERGEWHGEGQSGTLTVIVSIYVDDYFGDGFVDCKEIEATYTNGTTDNAV